MPLKVRAVGTAGFGTYDLSRENLSLTPTTGQADHLLVPGFVDIHIHGAYDIDLMDADPGSMLKLCDKLASVGYESFFPTTITASPEAVLRAIRSLPDHPMILGFHLEGPFISGKHPGAQPPKFIAEPSSLDAWQEILEHPKLRVITLAPEIAGIDALIRRLSSRGVVVSMGHSDATYEQARKGLQAGARHTTHTFNAMRGFHHREAGLAGFAMLETGAHSELIYDRVHVCREAASLLVRSKGKDGVIAVSDSSRATGLPAGTELTMWGHECVVGEDSVRLASNGSLAGSTITLLDAFRNLAEDFGAELAVHACSLNPRRALALGDPQSWLLLDESLEILERLGSKIELAGPT